MTTAVLPAASSIATSGSGNAKNPFTISTDTTPRRMSEAPRPRGNSLQGLAVGEPGTPRKQVAVVDASFLTMNRPVGEVIASDVLRVQLKEQSDARDGLEAGKTYAPLVCASQISAVYDVVRNRISMNVPGADGASTEVRLHLSADGKSVLGMEKYEWSEPEDLQPDLADLLAEHVLPEHVLNADYEVHKNFLDGAIHERDIKGLKLTLWYDASSHELCIAGLDQDGGEVRLALAIDGTCVNGAHKCSCSGPARVSTETLEHLVDAGLLTGELLALRRAASPDTPRSASRPVLPEAETTTAAKKPGGNRRIDRVPSPISTSQPSLGLALSDVIANPALRNQVHRDRFSANLDQSPERHKYTNRMANGDTIASWYEVRDGLIWITVGSDANAPCVRIRLAPDRKSVVRIDEPIARLPVASREPLTVLVEAGVIQPQALYALYPDPGSAASLQSPDPKVRLKAALGLATYRTAAPETETQKSRIDQWTDSLLWRLEVPYVKNEDGEEAILGHAIIDLREMSTKAQIDVLTKLGAVGWNALFEIAKAQGATEMRPLVQGRSAATLINAVKAAMPEIEQAIVLADPSVEGRIEVDLEGLNESAPAISIRIEDAKPGDSLDVYASSWPESVTVQPAQEWETSIDGDRMKLWRRQPDPEVTKWEALKYKAD